MTGDGPEPLRVLVTEPVMGRFADVLTRDGTSPHQWTFACGDSSAAHEAAATADVLVCSAVTTEMLAAAPRLRLVHVTGAGYDKIPLDALPHGVALANTFHHGRSIAEHVMMVAMMLLRRVRHGEQDMRAGVWRNAIVDDTVAFGGLLRGRAIGVVGFGEIGQQVGRLASAMGMRPRAVRNNPAAPLPEGLDVEWVGGVGQLPSLLGDSDVVVVTVPLSARTRGLLGAEAFAAMKPEALLVNVSRGPIVEEDALHDALSRGLIAGAAIDVWWRDPRSADISAPANRDFTGFDNVVLTPHQSGHTEETFRGRAHDIAANVDALATGRGLRNRVR